MSWPNETLLGFDFESTGVNPLECRPVTVSLVEANGKGELVRARGAVMNCDVEVPEAAAAIHGYPTERVNEEGRDPKEVLEKVLVLLDGARKEGIPIAGHNIRYDWQLLYAECERQGLEVVPGNYLVDTIVLDRKVDKWRKGSRKLVDTAAHYDVALLDAHTASADAFAACGVARAIGRTYPAVGDLTPAELHEAQKVWWKDWAVSFSEYLAKKGEPPVEGDWPL